MKVLYSLKGCNKLVMLGHYEHAASACIPLGTGGSLFYVATYSRGADVCSLLLASPSILLIPAAVPPLSLLCPGGQIFLNSQSGFHCLCLGHPW